MTSITTTLWLSGAAMLVPMSALAVDVVDGDLIRNPSAEGMAQLDIYIVKTVGEKNFKRLILSPHVFESYAHFDKNGNGDNWDDVMDVDQATMDAYTTTDLVREDGNDKVYRLYAAEGSDTGTKYWLNMTAESFTAVFDADAIYTINGTDTAGYTAGSNVTNASSTFPPAGGEVVVSTGILTATLAADTPAAGIAVGGAARFPFTKVNLTATGGDVVVDSMTIKRTSSIAQDGSFTSVAVILDNVDGDQLGNNKTLNSSHETALNDDLTIANGTTKSIYLVGNMKARETIADYAGEIPSLSLSGITLKGDATLNSNLPITGNYMTINGTVTIGTVGITDGSNQPSVSTQNVGAKDYTVSAVKITAGAAEAITIKNIVFTQDGSAGISDVENVSLINANTGEILATIEHPENKTISFPQDLVVAKGKNNSFDLRLDIVDGSGRDISYDIDETTDILVKGNTYGYYITPTYTTTGAGTRPEYDAADTSIGDGTLRAESVSVTPTTIAEDATSVLLGEFKFIAKGEEVKITSAGWKFRITTSTTGAAISDITNVTVYDESGSVVGGPMDPTHDNYGTDSTAEAYGAATTTDTIIVPVGETVYTVKGDLSADFAVNDTIQVKILPSDFTARGMTTDNSITLTPASVISCTALTVKPASLTVTVSSAPAAQTVVAGKQNHVFANYVFDASDSGTDVKITQVKVPVITVSTSFPDMVSGIELFDGTNEISVSSDTVAYSTAGSAVAGSSTTTLNITTGALVIPAGSTKTITVKADVGTGATGGSVRIGIQANGVTATDIAGNSISETCTPNAGQVMSLTSGGTLNLSAMTDPSAAFVVAGKSDVAVGKFSLQAKYEDIALNYLGVNLATPGSGIDATNKYDQIQSVSLYEDGVADAIGTIPVNAANATITPSEEMIIPAGETKSYTLKATFATLSETSPAESGAGVKFKVTNLDATGVSVGSSSITVAGLDATFSLFNIFKSTPTVTQIAFTGTDTLTSNGQVVDLIKFKVSANDAGPIGLYKFTFGISTTTVYLANTVADVEDTTGYYLYSSDSNSTLGDVISRGSAATAGYKADMNATAVGTDNNDVLLETYFDVGDNGRGTSTEQIIINAGSDKYFTLRGTVVSGYVAESVSSCSMSTVLAGDASFSSTGLETASAVDDLDQNDFIWSDLNADLYSSTTATATAMYVGGYTVSGLDNTTSTPAQTVTN